jgi:hypothetical protein
MSAPPDLASLKAVPLVDLNGIRFLMNRLQCSTNNASRHGAEQLLVARIPALIAEIERLRGGVAAAKKLGAVEELGKVEEAFRLAEYGWTGEYKWSADLDEVNAILAELRKELA